MTCLSLIESLWARGRAQAIVSPKVTLNASLATCGAHLILKLVSPSIVVVDGARPELQKRQMRIRSVHGPKKVLNTFNDKPLLPAVCALPNEIFYQP